MERDQKYGTKAICCLRQHTQHTTDSCFVKQRIYLHLRKQVPRKSFNEREPASYRNLWSPRKINFCRTVRRVVVFADVSINWDSLEFQELCFLSVFLVHDYYKGYFKFIFLYWTWTKTYRHFKNAINYPLILFSKDTQKKTTWRHLTSLPFEVPLTNVVMKHSGCCHPDTRTARLERWECWVLINVKPRIDAAVVGLLKRIQSNVLPLLL